MIMYFQPRLQCIMNSCKYGGGGRRIVISVPRTLYQYHFANIELSNLSLAQYY